jgi:hypothetical protein
VLAPALLPAAPPVDSEVVYVLVGVGVVAAYEAAVEAGSPVAEAKPTVVSVVMMLAANWTAAVIVGQ